MQVISVLKLHPFAIKKNLEVSVLELEKRVMERVVSPEVSHFFQKKHQSEGVKFKFNSSVIDIEDLGKQKRIICSDGSILNSDFVVIGVGIKPNIELAKSSGLECDNGIIVDEIGRRLIIIFLLSGIVAITPTIFSNVD